MFEATTSRERAESVERVPPAALKTASLVGGDMLRKHVSQIARVFGPLQQVAILTT